MGGYIGVDNTARKIKSMYIGIDGLARKVNTAYIGVNDVARKWYAGIDTSDPNTRYEDKSLGTWSSTSDVDTFFNTYTYERNWTGLSVGNYVTISDGTYNIDWVIAGFNTETASDGVSGGIVFIPRYVNLTTYYWSYNGGILPYKDSSIHPYINGTIKTNLSTILGSHIVQRNVTLGSEVDKSSDIGTTNSINTTAYLTLMSWGQLSGIFGTKNNRMDDGEANYILPLLDNIDLETYVGGSSNTNFWVRNVYGITKSTFYAYYIYSPGSINGTYSGTSSIGVRPLMYLR